MIKSVIITYCLSMLAAASVIADNNYSNVSGNTKSGNSTSNVRRPIDYKEQVYLHTNSSFLLTGETLYFKAYCTQSATLQLSSLSEIAYVDLVDADGASVLKTKIKLTNGTGYGDFFLPSTIKSGNYMLVAYTNWMKNHGQEHFFTSTITIINPFVKLPVRDDSIKSRPKISIYPEGGSIIKGMENTIAVKLNNIPGGTSSLEGKLVDNSGNTLKTFTTQFNGIGKVTFTPDSGKVYKVIITDASGKFHFKEIPQPTSKGYGLSIDPFDDHVMIHAYLLNNKVNYSEATLIVRTNSGTKKEYLLKFVNDEVMAKVPIEDIPEGAVYFSLIDADGKIVAERAYFNKVDKESGAEVINAKLEHQIYGNRKKVGLKLIGLTETQASVSVRKVESKIQDPKKTSESYFYLEHPSMTNMLSPSAYFDSDKENFALNIDNLMLTLGNKGDSKISNAKDSIKYFPDVREDLISGVLKSKTNGAPIQNQNVYLSFPSKHYKFYASETDENGRFYFNVKEVIGSSKMIIQADPNIDLPYEISLENEFINDYEGLDVPAFKIDTSFRSLIHQRSIHTQIENAYYEVKKDSIIPVDSIPFYQIADAKYLLDEYTRFPTMEDVLREYVPEVIVRSNKDQYTFKMIDMAQSNHMFQETPLLLIDGVPVFHPNDIIDYNPLKVKKLEVVSRKYYYGPLDCAGILSFETYNGNFEGVSLADNVLQKEIVGIQPEKNYYSPDYSSDNLLYSSTPDYRHQLYWDPEIILSEEKSETLSFYTSDVNGKYEVRIEGVSKNGKPFSKQLFFEVSSSLP